jgi:hypothetical protein
MQNIAKLLAVIALAIVPATAMARLTPYEDYTISDTVSQVSTIRVKANMMDHYLEGIRDTWVASNEVAKRLGHIQDYEIYISDLPNSGDFNLLLVTIFANTADLAPTQERYKEFMREWGDANEEKSEEVSTTVYPDIREITGDYQMRRLTIKPQ